LAAQYSIVAGCVIAGIGALILVAITILWLFWTHKIYKESQN
jgi:hypothetical protein